MSVIGPNRYPTYDDLREMKYLSCDNSTLLFCENQKCTEYDAVTSPTTEVLRLYLSYGEMCKCSLSMFPSPVDLRQRSTLLPSPERRLAQNLGLFQPAQRTYSYTLQHDRLELTRRTYR